MFTDGLRHISHVNLLGMKERCLFLGVLLGQLIVRLWYPSVHKMVPCLFAFTFLALGLGWSCTSFLLPQSMSSFLSLFSANNLAQRHQAPTILSVYNFSDSAYQPHAGKRTIKYSEVSVQFGDSSPYWSHWWFVWLLWQSKMKDVWEKWIIDLWFWIISKIRIILSIDKSC